VRLRVFFFYFLIKSILLKKGIRKIDINIIYMYQGILSASLLNLGQIFIKSRVDKRVTIIRHWR